MPRKKHSVDQIIGKLRQATVELSKGETVKAVVRKLGIAGQTYFRWREEYGGLKRSQAGRFKDMERENARLKRMAANQQIDIASWKRRGAARPGSELAPGPSQRLASKRRCRHDSNSVAGKVGCPFPTEAGH